MADTTTLALKTTGFLTAAAATYSISPWLVAFFSACAGAQWALSRITTPSRMESLSAFIRFVSASMVLSWSVEMAVSSMAGGPSLEVLAASAFWSAAIGDRINSMVDSAFSVAGSFARSIARKLGADDARGGE
jgi:hypothetical protein